mgnify:CR=1 FL=1
MKEDHKLMEFSYALFAVLKIKDSILMIKFMNHKSEMEQIKRHK